MERRRQSGYTMLEALATVAAIGILGVVAFPGLQSTLRTFQRNGAAREVLAEIRSTQNLAVTRGGVFGLHWGADPAVGRPQSHFRVVRDTTGACGFPATGAPEDGTNVIQSWVDLSDSYAGVRIASILDRNDKALSGVMFDSRGASVNTCTAASFPLRLTVADGSGGTRVIEVHSAGGTRLQ